VGERFRKAVLILSAVSLLSDVCVSQTQDKQSGPTKTLHAYSLQEALSWLPGDTETIIGANGPFSLSDSAARSVDSSQGLSRSELEQLLRHLPLGLFGLKNGRLGEFLKRQKIALAVEGSRHFREPSGLGEMLYEGCEIAVFLGEVRGDSFIKTAANATVGLEKIANVTVAAFKERLEEDEWTTFVAFPTPNVVVVATNRNYLDNVLSRMHGAAATRALPDSLPEWKYVNRRALVWGLRHYDSAQAELDPSSPFGGEKTANLPDDGAIGVAFYLGASDRRNGTMTYLSRNKDARQMLQRYLVQAGSEPASTGSFPIGVRELALGTIECSVPLLRPEALGQFLLVLKAMLGHAIYL